MSTYVIFVTIGFSGRISVGVSRKPETAGRRY
jgi:hypothetical protein